MTPPPRSSVLTQRSGANAHLGILALLVSAVTLVIVFWSHRTVEAPATMPADIADSARREQLAQLTASVEELRLELQRVAAQALASGPTARREPAPGDVDQKLRELDARVAKLDTALQQVQREVAAARRPGPDPGPGSGDGMRPPVPVGPRPDEVARIAEARQRAVDASLPEEERLKALRNLRGLGPGARSGEVALAMIQLAQSSQDPAVRADVWRQMSGAKDPVLVQPLLTAAFGDADEKVREEVAETLGDYLDRPEVREALERLARDDASLEVRAQALRSMGRRERR